MGADMNIDRKTFPARGPIVGVKAPPLPYDPGARDTAGAVETHRVGSTLLLRDHVMLAVVHREGSDRLLWARARDGTVSLAEQAEVRPCA
ncbi:hypothetical protein tb265_46980 [Gemmatimonadetes bacterium T265]|nr:hypothetical protein tb265_46980 [Gemmatimonadetes bacterium T265]